MCGSRIGGKDPSTCSPELLSGEHAPEGCLQPTMRHTDSDQHLYCTAPTQWPDLVKYVIVLTTYSPRRVNSIISALVGVLKEERKAVLPLSVAFQTVEDFPPSPSYLTVTLIMPQCRALNSPHLKSPVKKVSRCCAVLLRVNPCIKQPFITTLAPRH